MCSNRCSRGFEYFRKWRRGWRCVEGEERREREFWRKIGEGDGCVRGMIEKSTDS